MVQITLTTEQSNVIYEAESTVEIVDPDGNRIAVLPHGWTTRMSRKHGRFPGLVDDGGQPRRCLSGFLARQVVREVHGHLGRRGHRTAWSALGSSRNVQSDHASFGQG